MMSSATQLQWDEVEANLAVEDRIWHLRRARLFQGLSPAELHVVASRATDRIYPKGGEIFRQSDPALELFVLNRGTVRLSVVNPKGREKIVEILRAGEIFGAEVTRDAGVRQTQALAHEECWVSVLSRSSFLRLLSENTRFSLNLALILSLDLDRVRSDLEALSFLDVRRRTARALLNLGSKHGKVTAADESMLKLRIPVTHEQLACFVGGNRPHVSTILSKFRQQGLIRYQDRKLLIHVDRLRRVAECDPGSVSGNGGGHLASGRAKA